MVELEGLEANPELASEGILFTLDRIVERYGNGPRKDEPETAIELALEYSFLRFNRALSKGLVDEAEMWKRALELSRKENRWALLKNSVSNFDLILASNNGNEKREEYVKALQNLVNSF